MREPRWVDRLVVEAVHLDQIREHGGLAGLRDEGALEAALARPRHRWRYEAPVDLPALAATYGYGLCRSHPFRDGNKRVSFVVLVVFLELSRWRFEAEEAEVVEAMMALASGMLTEPELAAWIRLHARPRRR